MFRVYIMFNYKLQNPQGHFIIKAKRRLREFKSLLGLSVLKLFLRQYHEYDAINKNG